MKINKIIVFALIALPALVLQSCLKDDDDKFSESASARMDTYLSEAQQALMNAPYGWALDYYPESSQSYGGYEYTVKFGADSAAVRFENAFSDGEQISLYSMKKNDGPVLSFDTYNSFIHYFATPSSDLNEGYNGDFEFVIDSIGEDKVKVHGTRNHNVLYFRKLTESAATYMEKVVETGDNFLLGSAALSIGGEAVNASFDVSDRQVVFATATDTIQTAYTYTDKGLRFYQPVTINGVTVEELTYDDDALTLTGDGVTSEGCYVDPSLIANQIGAIGADDNAFTRTIKNLSHLDQFEFVPTADWVTVTASGTTLTVSGAANNTGSMRSATVYIVNKNNEDLVASFSVSQCALRDVLGTYTFMYYDYQNSLKTATATIAQANGGVTFSFDDSDGYSWSFSGTFNQSLGAIMLPQLQQVSSWNTRSYGTVYCYNVYGISDSGSYYFLPQLEMPLFFQTSDTYGTYAMFGGENLYYNGQNLGSSFNVKAIYLMVSQSSSISSSSDFLGYVDIWSNGAMFRQSSSSAKGFKNFVKKPSKSIRPVSIKRVSDAVKK